MELTFRFSSRLRAREAVRILYGNKEDEISVFVWEVDTDEKPVTINVLPRDADFCERVLKVYGESVEDTRAELLSRIEGAAEMYQGATVLQFPSWRRLTK